jgi:phenylpropionate dioxygenase-like ring-hydroxylating dioxygenase large terminal subunit
MRNGYLEVAKTHEIQPGQLKHDEVDGEEILISNINGKYYCLDDRCSHMNASLTKGRVVGKDIVCTFHAANLIWRQAPNQSCRRVFFAIRSVSSTNTKLFRKYRVPHGGHQDI